MMWQRNWVFQNPIEPKKRKKNGGSQKIKSELKEWRETAALFIHFESARSKMVLPPQFAAQAAAYAKEPVEQTGKLPKAPANKMIGHQNADWMKKHQRIRRNTILLRKFQYTIDQIHKNHLKNARSKIRRTRLAMTAARSRPITNPPMNTAQNTAAGCQPSRTKIWISSLMAASSFAFFLREKSNRVAGLEVYGYT